MSAVTGTRFDDGFDGSLQGRSLDASNRSPTENGKREWEERPLVPARHCLAKRSRPK